METVNPWFIHCSLSADCIPGFVHRMMDRHAPGERTVWLSLSELCTCRVPSSTSSSLHRGECSLSFFRTKVLHLGLWKERSKYHLRTGLNRGAHRTCVWASIETGSRCQLTHPLGFAERLLPAGHCDEGCHGQGGSRRGSGYWMWPWLAIPVIRLGWSESWGRIG